MKQHITGEQLKEIINYSKFIEQIENIVSYDALEMGGKYLADEINIGKMIEILGTNLKGINTPYDAGKYSGVFLTAQWECIEFKSDCLCDALWEAVKYVIEKEKN